MKTFITKLAIASVLCITIVALINISSSISSKTLSYRIATATQNQPGPEIIGNSYTEMMNSLFAGR